MPSGTADHHVLLTQYVHAAVDGQLYKGGTNGTEVLHQDSSVAQGSFQQMCPQLPHMSHCRHQARHRAWLLSVLALGDRSWFTPCQRGALV